MNTKKERKMTKKIKDKDVEAFIIYLIEANRPDGEELFKERRKLLLEGKFDFRHYILTDMAKYMFKNGYSLDTVIEVIGLPLEELEEIEIKIKATH